MQYSPKLKKAAQEIQHILKKYDIAGVVVIHTPGHSEFVCSVSPSYSCAKITGDRLRVKAKLNEDFGGDRQAWKQKVRDTSNMLSLLSETMASMTMQLIEVSEAVDAATGSSHTDEGFTSHTTQNN